MPIHKYQVSVEPAQLAGSLLDQIRIGGDQLGWWAKFAFVGIGPFTSRWDTIGRLFDQADQWEGIPFRAMGTGGLRLGGDLTGDFSLGDVIHIDVDGVYISATIGSATDDISHITDSSHDYTQLILHVDTMATDEAIEAINTIFTIGTRLIVGVGTGIDAWGNNLAHMTSETTFVYADQSKGTELTGVLIPGHRYALKTAAALDSDTVAGALADNMLIEVLSSRRVSVTIDGIVVDSDPDPAGPTIEVQFRRIGGETYTANTDLDDLIALYELTGIGPDSTGTVGALKIVGETLTI